MHRFFSLVTLWLVLWSATPWSVAGERESEVRHHVDRVAYDSQSNVLSVSGWLWDSQSQQSIQQLHMLFQGHEYEVKELHLYDRPDVQSALNIAEPKTGFAARQLLLPLNLQASQALQLVAYLQDGSAVALDISHLPALSAEPPRSLERHWLLLALVGLVCVLAAWSRWRQCCRLVGQWIQQRVVLITLGIVATFGVLVAAGVTGSSIQLLNTSPWNQGGQGVVAFEGQSKHWLKPRGVRSDEWLVLGPNTLAQWNHVPAFPVVNTNLGPQGQNMGVIGMTGVPIAQPAAIGRIATWGYFFLPLQQAMSWHWQLPFFACLLALWWMLNLLRPQSAGLNLLLSISFCVAPYAAGWSLWPLYACCFPLLLSVLGAHLLRTNRTSTALAIGAAMGVLMTGWVLVLYPPWQITVGTVLAVIAVGWCLDHRSELCWGWRQAMAVLLMLMIAGGVLATWWLDTADAVATMQATVYPGGRVALQGADIDAPWWALRGYLNPEVLTFAVPHLNQSEISAYLLVPLPLLLLGMYYSSQATRYRWTLRCCMAFALFWVVFRFFGIPLWLAKLTLWSHVSVTRLDLSLAILCTVLTVLAYGALQPFHAGAQQRWVHGRWPAWVVSVVSAALVIWQFQMLPSGVVLAQLWVFQVAIALAVAAAAWWMLRGQMGSACSMVLVLYLVSTMAFNPWSIAPQRVKLTNEVEQLIAAPLEGSRLRTLVLSNSTTPSMLLAAAGAPVLAGVLYYPHASIWQGMGLSQEDWPVVNRYQHLTFELGQLPDGKSFTVSNSQADTVIVKVNAQHFDFAATGADMVAALESDAQQLVRNEGLTSVGVHRGWHWFKVRQTG